MKMQESVPAPASWTMAGPGPLTDEAARWVVSVAVRAPSVHNTQPWIFRWDGDHLEIHADPARRLQVADPAGRQQVMSCGAALMFARLALRALGRSLTVTLMPEPWDGPDADLLARVTVGPVISTAPSLEEWALLSAVPARHTVRSAFQSSALPTALRDELIAAAMTEGAHLRFIDAAPDRESTAVLVAAADRMQEGQGALRSELSSWLRESDAPDGIPLSTAGHGWLQVPGEFRLRDFDVNSIPPATTGANESDHPMIAVLETAGDSPSDWMAAGQALARVMLVATCGGVHASMINQPLEIAGTRHAMRESLGMPGYPQAILRLGYGTPGHPTGRRPVETVLTISP